MAVIGAFLAAAVGPLAKRAAVALGVGVVTFAGVDASVGALISHAQSAWTGMGAQVSAYVAMAGLNTALSITCGALTARVSMLMLKRLALL